MENNSPEPTTDISFLKERIENALLKLDYIVQDKNEQYKKEKALRDQVVEELESQINNIETILSEE